ncbi:MAG: hypothetical protein EOO37_00060 [Cytophagaceae bacterium]|nr:MAG: hypothetical protein EOO37_00060 [Cytophagaceae bacterium]
MWPASSAWVALPAAAAAALAQLLRLAAAPRALVAPPAAAAATNMARGIGGDDGPTLWMFVACILIWGKVKGWFDSGLSELDKNHANPFQPETNAEIRNKEKVVKEIAYRPSKFQNGHKLSYYQQLADSQFKELMSTFNIDEDKLINMLKPLNVDELKAVAKCFGVRDSASIKSLGFATGTGTIFEYYDELLSDSTLGGNDLTQMRKIWQPTGLWSGF